MFYLSLFYELQDKLCFVLVSRPPIYEFISTSEITVGPTRLQYFNIIKKHSTEGVKWLNVNKLSQNKSNSKYMIFHVHNEPIQYLALKTEPQNQPEEPQN